MLRGQSAQLLDESRKIVLLEEADTSDAGGAGIKTGTSILEGHASESENGSVVPASLVESVQSGWDDSSFFEDRAEDCEVGGLCGGDVLCRMTRHRYVGARAT